MNMVFSPIPDYGFDDNFNNLTNASFDPVNMTAVAVTPYTDILGSVFYGLLFAGFFGMVWMRQEDITMPALLGLIIGGSIWSFMPGDWTSMAMSLTVVSFGGLMYSIVKGKN